MRVVKRLLCPERVRRVPDPFSWVDHRLVRYKHIRGCSPEALALYLPLVTVGDARGLSHDGDATVAGVLSMSPEAVARARRKLLDAAQIAAELDPHPDTVTRWLNEPKSRPRNPSMRARKLDPFKPLILKMLERYPYSAARILGRLREDGYEGGPMILKDFPANPPRCNKNIQPGRPAMPSASSSTHWRNQPVDPLRLRRFPRQFAPVDRRLVYHKHIRRMSTEAMALYLFLECVSDPQGLSFYSDERISELLHWSLRGLWNARDRLCEAGFLLYRRPFYQLLELPDSETIR